MAHASVIVDSAIDHQTKVFCIISDQRVFRSKSPEIFNAVFERTGIRGAYVPLMIAREDIGKALECLQVLNVAGANITAPFKEMVLPYLDVLSEGANIIGAVNTIVCKDGELKGYNTNAIGIMDALNRVGFDVAGKKALVIGTGGAARAVVFILNWLRADSVIVAGRDDANTRRIADQFDCTSRSLEDLGAFPLSADILINATSVSNKGESAQLTGIVENMRIHNCELVFDLNYGQKESLWQSLAVANGTSFMDGLSTLAYQAKRTFLLWTGREIPHQEFLKPLG